MTKALLAALGLSTLVNVFLALTTRNTVLAAQKSVRAARDNADERIRIAEARYERLLDRIEAGERIRLAPAPEPVDHPDTALSERKPWISDSPITGDAEWDEYVEPGD